MAQQHNGHDRAIRTRILVADDDPAIVELLEFLLEDEGYEVLRASDGLQALAAIRCERPQLVITDNMMPGLSGRDLVARLRVERHPVPIILMSAAPCDTMPPRTLFLSKPFHLEQVLAAVDRLLPAPPRGTDNGGAVRRPSGPAVDQPHLPVVPHAPYRLCAGASAA